MTADAETPAETTVSLTVVVVTYNTRELALELLADLVSELEAFPDSQIVVFDNASDDGTADAVRERFPAIQVEASADNLGFAAAVNRAAAAAQSRWLLLVNPDARIDSGAVRTLVDAARQRPGHGLYGGRFVDMARGTAEDSVAVVPTLAQLAGYATGVDTIARRFGYRSAPRQAAASATNVEVDALPGCFLLVEMAAWKELGGFDERYFMYGEDLDLSVRMARSGRRPMYVPSASIRHAGGASSSSGRKQVLKLTSLVTFVHSHWPPWQARLADLFLLTGVGLRRTARLPFRTPSGRWETAWRERRSWRDGW
jgi:GT2 family glycosyltransferase